MKIIFNIGFLLESHIYMKPELFKVSEKLAKSYNKNPRWGEYLDKVKVNHYVPPKALKL